MKQLSKFPNQELLNAKGPFVSIYQVVELIPPNAETEQVRFKNLQKAAKEKVKENCTGAECEALLKQLDSVPNDKMFWSANTGSVGFFFTPQETYYYQLNNNVKNDVVFGDKPAILPLIENYQYIDNYYLLCLSNDEFKLYRGIFDRIERVALPEDAPTDMIKALGEEMTVRGKLERHGSGGEGGGEAFHGYTEVSDEQEIDQENFFRIVDEYVYENYSRPSQLPVVLFALPEHHPIFQTVSKNSLLRKKGIELSPTSISDQEIQKEAAKYIDRLIKERHREVLDRYRETTPQYKLGDQFQDLAMASLEGRIETLFVEKSADVKGSIDENGQYVDSGDEDFLCELALNVMRTNGKVYVLEKAQMPALQSVAAIMRY